jgi:archaellum biogenesis ATPase FlaH
LFDIFFECHLVSSEKFIRQNVVERSHLSLSLDDNFFDQTLILLEIQVVNMSKSHTDRQLGIIPDHRKRENILR